MSWLRRRDVWASWRNSARTELRTGRGRWYDSASVLAGPRYLWRKTDMSTARIYDRPLTPAVRITLLMLIAIAGLFYVKWMPYYHKAFLAADNHSIGKSILMGAAAQAPPASWRSALDYGLAYGKAIWQAMILGLLLGSAIQEFAPRAWIARQLGRSDIRSVTLGVLLAMPAMMCTCCAAPVVIGLRRANASAAAAVAFWLGNTMLNPAALVFMGFVLGWKWVGLRLALGIPMIFGTGYLINYLARSGDIALLRKQLSQAVAESESRIPSVRSWLKRFTMLFVGFNSGISDLGAAARCRPGVAVPDCWTGGRAAVDRAHGRSRIAVCHPDGR